MTSQRADRRAQVESQVSYHRKRLALYVERLDGSRPNAQRMEELERAYRAAQDRLALLAADATHD
ncbi:MAG: hypothetical protein QOH46_1441 [Solirubrobacteraceae bacterium]|jgi:hypothetical protein|nr:hypothetical protein [Solirubrobacteraceae bacterium]